MDRYCNCVAPGGSHPRLSPGSRRRSSAGDSSATVSVERGRLQGNSSPWPPCWMRLSFEPTKLLLLLRAQTALAVAGDPAEVSAPLAALGALGLHRGLQLRARAPSR